MINGWVPIRTDAEVDHSRVDGLSFKQNVHETPSILSKKDRSNCGYYGVLILEMFRNKVNILIERDVDGIDVECNHAKVQTQIELANDDMFQLENEAASDGAETSCTRFRETIVVE